MPRFALLALALLAVVLGGCHARSPSPLDARTVAAAGALDNRFVRADRPTPIVARLVVEARPSERALRPAVNLALVIDTSGSMEGRAIEDARVAAKALLGALKPKDRLAVITFGSTTETILPSTVIEDADLPKLHGALDRMQAIGTTDMAGGLREGMAEVTRSFVNDGVNRVVLLGDGDPNDAGPVKRLARDAGARNVSVTALGLGPEYNETLMGEVAQVSGGVFHYVADSARVAQFFRAEVVRLNTTYARNAVVTLVPGPGVKVLGVIGQREGTRSIAIGDISQGERREILVKLEAPAHHEGATVELLDAVVRFSDVASESIVERRVFFGARATADERARASGRDPEVERAAARAEAAAATLAAIEAARSGEMDKAKESAKKASEYGYEFADEQLMGALPSVAPARVQAGKPLAPNSSDVVRKAHDGAMKVLQTH